jgi:nickel/cobalt transporter (NicO) family protein
VSGTTPALVAAAAGVGFGHAILPDHWLPLAVVGRVQKHPLRRVARLSLLAGVAHVLVSILLGGLIIAVGLQFRHTIESSQSTIIGVILILTGLGFVALELSGHGHGHDGGHGHARWRRQGSADERAHGRRADSGHEHERRPRGDAGHAIAQQQERLGGLAAIMVPFGAAASPDLTILPVFLAASAAGVFAALGALLVFAVVTIATIVGLTLFACFGGYKVEGAWLEDWGNAVTAVVLVLIGGLVLFSVI